MSHLAFKYHSDIEMKLGASLPPLGEPIPPQVEVDISYLVAEASQKLTQSDIQEQAAKQRAAEQQDPLNQLERERLSIDKMDVVQKGQAALAKIQADSRARAEAEATKRMKIQADMRAKAADSNVESEYVDMEIAKYEDGVEQRQTEIELMKAQIAEMYARIDAMSQPKPTKQ